MSERRDLHKTSGRCFQFHIKVVSRTCVRGLMKNVEAGAHLAGKRERACAISCIDFGCP